MQNKFISNRYNQLEVSSMGNSSNLVDKYDDIINFSIGDPGITTDERIIKKAFEDALNGHTSYTNPLGDMELRQEIKKYYSEEYSYNIDINECMVTTSGCHAMWLILESILNDNEEVVVIEPYFSIYPDQIKLARGKTIFFTTKEEEEFQINVDELRKTITNNTKAIIINTPNNPTGTCLSRESLENIAKVAKEFDILVIADDIYTAFSFDEDFVPITTLDGMRERTISIRSLSKDFCMTGWRVGYVVAPPQIIQTMKTVNENNVYSAPSISQRAALYALKMRNEIQPKIVEKFKERMEYAYKRISNIDKISVLPPRGSIYMFVNIKETGMTSEEFCDYLLEKCHILAIPGNAFGQAGEGYVRIAMTVDVGILKEAFDRIETSELFNKNLEELYV